LPAVFPDLKRRIAKKAGTRNTLGRKNRRDIGKLNKSTKKTHPVSPFAANQGKETTVWQSERACKQTGIDILPKKERVSFRHRERGKNSLE
jgi:hypothetical protein